MAYTYDSVKQGILRSFGGVASLAASVGQGENTRDSQHVAAIEFWTLALSIPEDEVTFDRAFAQSEIDRHEAELVKSHPPVSQRIPPTVV